MYEKEVGCFTRKEENAVICPMGLELHKTRNKKGGTVYANKDACRQCTNRCTDSKSHKTVYFGKGTTHVAVRAYGISLNRPPENMVFHNSYKRHDRKAGCSCGYGKIRKS